ncbi:MAG: hypothetical protein HYV02_08665 [Deltaproteobacteria bacterium]|nr:hypothetical protein [Deltaproteobacteria bacterium]
MGAPKRKRELDNGGRLMISTETTFSQRKKDPILELQLSMAASSINHEYARIEYDETPDRERREQLLDYMEECRSKYVDAREQLQMMSPSTVDRFEAELIQQKKMTLNDQPMC